MIYIFPFIALVLFSCNKDSNVNHNNVCEPIQFEIPFEMTVGSSVCLPDGRKIQINEAADEYCPCDEDILCNWEGQLVLNLLTIDHINGDREIRIGSHESNTYGNLFEDVYISDFTYLYNESNDSLPLCEGTYDQQNITIVLTISN